MDQQTKLMNGSTTNSVSLKRINGLCEKYQDNPMCVFSSCCVSITEEDFYVSSSTFLIVLQRDRYNYR